MTRTQISLPVLLCLGLSACGGLDCFDDGPLEAAFADGEVAAEEQNLRDHEQGRQLGLSLTLQDGRDEGLLLGYEYGYSDGYNSPAGFASGYDAGYDTGDADGRSDPAACSDGAAQGAYDGDGDGYNAGYDAGYSAGYGPGYDDGYTAAQSECSDATGAYRPASVAPTLRHADEPDPDDVEACYQRGYRVVFDESAYPRGLAAGKLENPDFQEGYHQTYPDAYDSRQFDGQLAGYADGQDSGYADGYDDGYNERYTACYADGYEEGYDEGYGAGDADGYEYGYEDGYLAGYDDGRLACS